MPCLRNIAPRKTESISEKDDMSTETQAARAYHEDVKFNVNVERVRNWKVTKTRLNLIRKSLLSLTIANRTHQIVMSEIFVQQS